MKRHVLLIAIAGVLGIVFGLVADAAIAKVVKMNYEMNQKAEAELKSTSTKPTVHRVH